MSTEQYIVEGQELMRPIIVSGDFSRVIVDFRLVSKSMACETLARRIWEDLNSQVATTGMSISGAAFTTAKALILTITPPSAALRFMQADVQDRLRAYLVSSVDLRKETSIWVYPDEIWHRVVVHQIRPKAELRCKEDALRVVMWELLTYNPSVQGTPAYMLSRARFLRRSRGSIGTAELLSLCVPLRTIEDVRKLVKEGAFIDGKRHRVSVYVDKPKSMDAK